ncbi:MAG: 50S ribosomal protein L15 [Candidatus Sumerlaeaceae bacterium]|nr:50S ribosomal protein L15 [Candidatus Sumerlaeaceae bacterium]
MRIHELGKDPGRTKKRKRRGRGEASGLGRTAGYGNKGSQARSGRGKGYGGGFEGGQMPLQRRLPKRGFHNKFRERIDVVNLRDLDGFEANAIVDVDALKKAGRVRGRAETVKVLGNGELTKPLTVRAHMFSKTAKERIEALGGKAETLSPSSEKGA